MLGKIGVAASPARSRPGLGADRARRRGRPLPLRRRRRRPGSKVSRQPESALARLVLHAHHRRPADADTVYVNNLQTSIKATDGGKTFVEIPTPHGDNHDLWIDPDEQQARMIQGNDGGANVSLNGGYTWSARIYNQPTAQFYHLATDNRDPYIVYGTQQDNSSDRRAQPRQPRRDHLGRLLYRRDRRKRLHRRPAGRPEHRLCRRDRLLARRRQSSAALRPQAPTRSA